MRELRTNTATRVTIGPFFDKTDGITPKTALTVTNCKLTFTVDDAGVPTLVLDTNPTASGGSNDMIHISGDDAGFYDLELAAANVNYLGRAMLALTDASNHCPVFHEFQIITAAEYDRKYSTGASVADVYSRVGAPVGASISADIAGVQADTDNIQTRIPAALTANGNMKSSLVEILTTALTETTGQIAAAFKQFFNIASPTSTMNTITTVTTATNLTNAPTAGDLTATMKTSVTTAASAATPSVTVSDKTGFSLSTAGILAIWHQLTSAIATAGSIGKLIVDYLDAAVSSRSTYAGGDTSGTTTLLGRLTSTRAGLLDNLDATVSSRLPTSSYTAPLDAAGVRTAVGLASANLDTQLGAIDDYIDTEVAAIKAKTDNLPADPADASDIAAAFTTVNSKLDAIDDYIDTEVAAIKAKTDNLPAAPAASSDIPTAAAIRAEIDANSTKLDVAVSTRLSSAGYTAPANSDITAIKAKTDNLPADPADASDIAAAFVTVNGKLDAIDDYVDTEVAAIKAKTDNLPASPAATGDIPTADITAIKAKTDSLTFTVAGQVDANAKAINDTALTGDGSATPWGPA